MILIIDSSFKNTALWEREQLLSEGIPCAACDLSGALELLPAAFVFVTEGHIMEDVKYMCSMIKDLRVIFCKERSDIIDLARSMACEYLQKYESVCCPVCRSREEGIFYIYSKPVYLTKTEELIVTALLAASAWYTPHTLAAFCKSGAKSSADSIGVHICNINKKVRAAVGRDIIECKRYKGYRIIDL